MSDLGQPGRTDSWRWASSIERRRTLLYGALIMLITTLPYLLGYQLEGFERSFTGFVFGVEDGNSYIAKMLNGWAGDWIFRTPYTAYPQSGLLMYLPYLLLGKLASPPGLHLQLTILFHIFRIAAGLLALLASYDFLAYFIRDLRLRRFGWLLVCLGGGLGWLLLLTGQQEWLGSIPLEFYSPEAFGFLSLYGLPHLSIARALMLWSLLAYLRLATSLLEPASQPLEPGTEPEPRSVPVWRHAVLLTLLWLLVGVFQPLATVILGLLILLHLVSLAVWSLWLNRHESQVNWSALLRLVGWVAAAGLLPGLFTGYNVLIAFYDPYASVWTAQNVIRSPHFLHYLLAYGLLMPFAWVGARRLLREDGWRAFLLISWVLALPFLAYAPLDLQRRLTEGVWVAWCTLGVAAFDGCFHLPDSQLNRSTRLQMAPLLLAFPSALILIWGGLLAARSIGSPVYRAADEVQVFEHLAQVSPARSVVLAAFETSNALPAWAPVYVLIGHGPESIHLADLAPQVTDFYQSETSDQQRQALIQRFGIDYVFWGPAERALGDWAPQTAPYLSLVTQQGDYALYEVLVP